MKKLFTLLLLVASLTAFGASNTPVAVDYTWNGATDLNWNTTTNWTPNGTPGTNDNVTINSASPLTITLTAATTVNTLIVSGGSTISFAGAFAFNINSGLTFSGGTLISLTSTQAFTLGNGSATFSLTGNDASNYFTGTSGNGYLALNTSSAGTLNLYVDPNFTWYNFVISKGIITLKSNCLTSRLGLSSLNTQKLILGNNVTFTLNATGSSSLGTANNAGWVDASASSTKFVVAGNSNAHATVFSGAYKLFASTLAGPASINHLEINVPSNVYTPHAPLSVNTLTLTSGNVNNATNNITILNGGTITKASQTAVLSAPPVFGTTGTDKVNINYTTTCTAGNELFGTTGAIGTITVNDAVTTTLSNSSVSYIALSAVSAANFTSPTVTFSAPTGANGVTATATCLTSGTSPAKTLAAIHITNPGYGYTSAPTVTITDTGAGTATGTASIISQTATTNIDALTIGTGTSGSVSYPNTSNKVVTLNVKDITVNNGGTFTCGTQTNSVTHLLNLGGNLVKNGTFTTTTASGKVVDITLNGTTAQSIPALTFNNLTLNNAAGASLTGTATVNGTLTLTAGNLTLGANNLTIAAAGTISGGSSSSYIVTNGAGTLTKTATSGVDKTFPIGTVSSYDPATVNSGTTVAVSAKVSTTLNGSASLGNTYNGKEWSIVAASGTPSAVITLSPAVSTYTTTPIIGSWNGSSYVETAATLSGASDPYSYSATQTLSTSSSFTTGGSSLVTDIKTTSTGIKVYGANNQIIVENANGSSIEIYSVTGAKVKSIAIGSEKATIAIEKGIYIVSLNNVKSTVLVK